MLRYIVVAMCNWLAEEAQTSYEEYGNDCKLATAVMVALGVRLIAADEWPVLRMLFGHDELIAALPQWD